MIQSAALCELARLTIYQNKLSYPLNRTNPQLRESNHLKAINRNKFNTENY